MEKKKENKKQETISIFILLGMIIGLIFIFQIFYDKFKDNRYIMPQQTPFVHSVGIDYSVLLTEWQSSGICQYSQENQYANSYCRLKTITKDFKMVRVYSYLTAGFEQTKSLSPEGWAVTKAAKEDKDIEVVLGTSNRDNLKYYADYDNVDAYVQVIKDTFGTSINQVKTILIGNEINSVLKINKTLIDTIMVNYKKSQKQHGLNIPVTATFSNLPNQKGDALSDSLVKAIVQNWDTSWNKNHPFVFIDPYPDAKGIDSAGGVFVWQQKVYKYYRQYYPTIEIFIAETGGEGCMSDGADVRILNQIFAKLEQQNNTYKTTIPTFIFEGVNEPKKDCGQQYMGVYADTTCVSECSGDIIKLKDGIVLPKFLK